MIQQFRPIPQVAARLACALTVRVFSFDTRYFGLSEGLPRHNFSFERFEEDWLKAVKLVRSMHNVDRKRFALWGTSLSGGMVVKTAANLKRQPCCVYAQVPGLKSAALKVPSGLNDSKKHLLKTACLIAADATLERIGSKKAYTVPFVGGQGFFCRARFCSVCYAAFG
jgi:hypothetical protein